MKLKKYVSNCFLLLIPILLWNLALFSALPEAFSPEVFWKDIPPLILYGENIFRIAVMVSPVMMIYSLQTRNQKIGLSIYLIGVALYFCSWILLILYPESDWGRSSWGFMAPAYTPVIWLIGIGLIGQKSFFKMKNVSSSYIFLALLFVLFHTLHAFIVYQRL